jgi:hypothetical protein
MAINAIYLYWTQNRYSCGLHVAAASISGIPTRRTAPAREGSQWKNSVVGRLLARNAVVLTTDQFPGGWLHGSYPETAFDGVIEANR